MKTTMIPSVFFVKNTARTKDKMVSRLGLEQLRMLMDWQLRQLGYCPQSVTEACRKAAGE